MTGFPIKRRCVIDAAIGETRAAVWEGKTLAELYVRRWTAAEQPRLGDRFSGRVRRIEKSLGAAFIDIGTEPDGFLKLRQAGLAFTRCKLRVAGGAQFCEVLACMMAGACKR